MDNLKLTDAEQRVIDATLECMAAIRDLYDGRNPCNFENEGIPAIHVLQQFARQHWAHRIAPEDWADWTEDEPKPGKAEKRKLFQDIYGHPLYVIDQRPTKGHIAEFVALCEGVIRGDVTPRS